MRKPHLESPEARDKYIRELALQVMRATGIGEGDFLLPSITQYDAVGKFVERVEGWVTANLKNPETLTRVISCAIDSVRSGKLANGRVCPLVNVTRAIDGDGEAVLRYLATRTICAAIYDHFFFTFFNRLGSRKSQVGTDPVAKTQPKFRRVGE